MEIKELDKKRDRIIEILKIQEHTKKKETDEEAMSILVEVAFEFLKEFKKATEQLECIHDAITNLANSPR